MIICPNCKKSLPDWSVKCQFCGADTATVPRPVAPVTAAKPRGSALAPSWIWPAYYGICIWYMIQAIYTIVNGLLPSNPTTPLDVKTGPHYVICFVGGLSLLFAIGLVLKIEFIRSIVNFICFLKIGCGLLTLVAILFGSFLVATLGDAFGFLTGIIMTVIDIAASGFMIYLIGETD